MSLPEIQSALDRLGIQFAFYYRAAGAEPFLHANAARFSAASMIKVPMLLAWARLEQAGLVSRFEECCLDSEPQVRGAGFAWQFATRTLSYQDVLLMMIATSDNLCTNLVIRRAGMEMLNRQFQEMGLEGVELQRRVMDFEARQRGLDNVISVQGCIRLFTLVEALPPDQRAWIDSILRSTVDAGLLARNLPREFAGFHHKTGTITGVLHDWGYTGDKQIFLLMNGIRDEPAAVQVFGMAGELLA